MIVRAKIVETRKGDIALKKNQGATFNSMGEHLLNYFDQSMPEYNVRDNPACGVKFLKEKRRGFIKVPEMFGYMYSPLIGPKGYSWNYHNEIGRAKKVPDTGEPNLYKSVPPFHWLNDDESDKWRLLGGEVEQLFGGLPKGDALFYQNWHRDGTGYQHVAKVQDCIYWSWDNGECVRLMAKHECEIYNDKCLAVNAPVMFGFHFRNSKENLGSIGSEAGGSCLFEIKIRTLGYILPTSYSSNIPAYGMDNWKYYPKAEYLYIRMYAEKVKILRGKEYWTLGQHIDQIEYYDQTVVGSFDSRINRTKPDGYWCEYCYVGLIPFGDCILFMYNVNGVVTYHPVKWVRTLPFDKSAFNNGGEPEASVEIYDEERKNYVENFEIDYNSSYSTAENTKVQAKNLLMWEHLAGVMLSVKEGICPVDIFAGPMLFNMYPIGENKYPRLSTNISFLGYKPSLHVADADSIYPNPEIQTSICSPDQSTRIFVLHIYDFEDDPNSGKTPDNTYKSQVTIAAQSYYAENTWRDYKFMESGDTDLGISTDASQRYATVTPLIKMIRRIYHPENMTQPITDTDRYLTYDIVNIERSNSAESANSIAIERLRLTIICYNIAHGFLKAGKQIRIETIINEDSSTLGYFTIRKVLRSRADFGMIKITLECQSILSRIDRTPIVNCEVFDGYDPRMAVEKLLAMADLNYLTKTSLGIDDGFPKMDPKLSQENLEQLPFSTSSNKANFRPRFGSIVRNHLEKILAYTGYRIDIDHYGKVWFYPELRPEEQVLRAFFVDDYEDTVKTLEHYGYGTVVYDGNGEPSVVVTDVPQSENPVRMIPFSSLEEVEPDELVTRVLVLGPNMNLDHHTRPHVGKRNTTSVPLPSILSNLNMASMTNFELEKELGEMRLAIYADRNLISGHAVSDLAEYLFRATGKRIQYYQLEVPDLSRYSNLMLYDKVRLFSRTAGYIDNADGMNRDVYGNQLSDLPCQVYPWRDFRIFGFSVRFTKTSVGGTVYLAPYLPDFRDFTSAHSSSSVFEQDVKTTLLPGHNS